jgi:Leucine-rich repeat (LRR) protein
MKSLAKLELEDNIDLTIPPPPVVLKGTEAIKAFLRGLLDAYETLSLDLTGLSLTYLVDQVYQMTLLTSLKLLHNEIKELPEDFGNLTNLVSLNLIDNLLVKLPMSFSCLTALRDLRLSYNQLEELPEELAYFENLRQLWISNNKIELLPYETYRLTSLTELLCTANPLLDLPQGLQRLTNIRKLQVEVYDLTILTNLRFIMDEVESLRVPPRPIVMNGSGVVLNYVKRINNARQSGNLVLDKMSLRHIPVEVFLLTNLTRLKIMDNEIQTIPPEIQDLQNLKQLILDGNQLRK